MQPEAHRKTSSPGAQLGRPVGPDTPETDPTGQWNGVWRRACAVPLLKLESIRPAASQPGNSYGRRPHVAGCARVWLARRRTGGGGGGGVRRRHPHRISGSDSRLHPNKNRRGDWTDRRPVRVGRAWLARACACAGAVVRAVACQPSRAPCVPVQAGAARAALLPPVPGARRLPSSSSAATGRSFLSRHLCCAPVPLPLPLHD
jgi:hypothetical protein